MSQIQLNFFGRFEVKIAETPITGFSTDKARALLVYLALEQRAHTRKALAGLLWPDTNDKHALTNLRNTLHRLRRTLNEASPGLADKLLTIERRSIEFNANNAVVDVLRFETLTGVIAAPADTQTAANIRTVRLADAAALYQGALLDGFDPHEPTLFDEWLYLRREFLHQRALHTFSLLASELEAQGQYQDAYAYAQTIVKFDPFREDGYRSLLRLLAQMGRANEALNTYNQMGRLFREDMDVEPSEDISALMRQIVASEYPSASVSLAATDTSTTANQPDSILPDQVSSGQISHAQIPPSSSGHEVPQSGPFFGRDLEMNHLATWLGEGCRIVVILGIGGVGKTSLATRYAQISADQFDVVLWRSLLNAPTLDTLLPSILEVLSDGRLIDLPQHLDEQLRMLTAYMRDRRVLLVLDNLESILQAEPAGDYHAGYEDYRQLIAAIAGHKHQSHLLITSRERPGGYLRLEGDRRDVRSLQLDGLDEVAGQALLTQRGLSGKAREEMQLVHRYSGNPLALKLVAETVEELFNGDISQFLTEETLVFDDVRAVLDQQFARLSPLEYETLIWLAVEREAVAPQDLRRSLLYVPRQREFIEALLSLTRRSLVERLSEGFVLQSVVGEYLIDRVIEQAYGEIESGQFDLLHRHALLKAQAADHVRQSQARLILAPIAERLVSRYGRANMVDHFLSLLEDLRTSGPRSPSYAGGVLLNLLLHLGIDITGFDFTQLCVWQASLRGVSAERIDFTDAELSHSTFTDDFGHVKAIAFSPDDQMVAVGTDDSQIRLWRVTDGQPMRVLQAPQSLIDVLTFCPDGRRLISASSLGADIQVWDLETGEICRTLRGHVGGIGAIAFSADGQRIASGGHDQKINLWHANSGALLHTLEGHTDWISSLAFHPNDELLVSRCHDQPFCHLWPLDTAASNTPNQDGIHTAPTYSVLDSHGNHGSVDFHGLDFSPDGKLLAISGDNSVVQLWDTRSWQLVDVLSGHGDSVTALFFTNDGTRLITGSHDATVRVWDMASGEVLDVMRRHNLAIWAMAVSSDGEIVVSGGIDGLICLWRPGDHQSDHAVRTLHGYVAPLFALAANPDGLLLATGERRGHIRLWDMTTPEPTAVLLEGHTELVDDVAFDWHGRLLASAGHDNQVLLWDIKSGECLEIVRGNAEHGTHAVFHPNSNLLATSAFDTITLRDISVPGKSTIISVLRGHTQDIRRLAFSPDGFYLASTSIDGIVRIWDVASGRCLHVLEEGVNNFWSITFSPNGALLAGAGRSGIHLWDLQAEPIIELGPNLPRTDLNNMSNCRSVNFSLDGKRLVSGGGDRVVRVWDVVSGAQIQSLHGHEADVTETLFLPGQHRPNHDRPNHDRPGHDVIASSSYDGTLRLWDVRTGLNLKTMRVAGPYAGMKIRGATGITDAQRVSLLNLGAVD